MFQIGGLIIFCGLLAQLEALSLPLTPEASASSPTDLAGNFADTLNEGLVSGGLLDKLNNLPLLDLLRPGKGNAGGLVGLLGKVISSIPLLNNIVDLKITNSELLELGLVPSHDGHRLFVTIPLGFVLNVKTHLTGSLLKVSVKLNITAEAEPVRGEDQKIHVVVGDCTHSPGNLKISLLDGHIPIIQKLIDSLTAVLNKVVPELLQKEVCPLVNGLLSQFDGTLVHNIINQLIQDVNIKIKV